MQDDLYRSVSKTKDPSRLLSHFVDPSLKLDAKALVEEYHDNKGLKNNI